MEIITEAGPGSGEGGFCPFIEWAACFSKPVNYISQHSLCLPSFQSQCHHRSSGLSIHGDPPNSNCFKISFKPRKKDPNSVFTEKREATVMQLLCTALKMKLDIGGRENGLSCCFSSLLFSSHRRQRGLGSITLIIGLYITNNAYWKIRAFSSELVKTFCFLLEVESFRRREEHAWCATIAVVCITYDGADISEGCLCHRHCFRINL